MMIGKGSIPNGIRTVAWHPATQQPHSQPAVWYSESSRHLRYAPTVSEWYRHLKIVPAALTATTATTGYHVTIHYTYDAHGHLAKVSGNDETHPYWIAQSADAQGHVTSAAEGNEAAEGNGITTTRIYDRATGALTSASASAGVGANASVQLTQYDYGVNGNLISRHDSYTGQSETYTYSSLNRLTGATATLSNGTTGTTLSAGYDNSGNLTGKNGQSYSYDPSHPDRLASFAGTAYQYDNAGRVLAGKDALSIGWTAFGKPYEITRSVDGTSHKADFWYDPEQVRYKQVVDNTEQISLAGGAFQIIHVIGSADTDYRMAIIAAGVVIGQVETSTNGTSAIHYFYRDNLGSVVVIADGNGNVTQRLAYSPYGTRRNVTNWNQPLTVAVILGLNLPTDRGFTGQHALDALKLVDYGGRIYDLETGRFLSPDPTGAEPNPYAYARNNPESLIDPTGYFSFGDVIKIAAIAAATYFTAGAAAGAAGGWSTLGGSLAGGATGGFTSGFLGSDGNLRAGFYGAVSGAAMGGLGYGFGSHLTTAELVGRSVAEGAVGGMLSVAGGGNFGDGFLGAFASSMAAPEINTIGNGSLDAGSIAEPVAASAALGGTVSRLNGGSFANGAISAAFQRLFNDEQHMGQDPSDMKLSAKGLALLEKEEGYSSTIYPDDAGNPTIGYGHLLSASEAKLYAQGITKAQALALLKQDVQAAQLAVQQDVTVRLTQNQFDALVSFAFNVGVGNQGFGGSTLLRMVNNGNFSGAAQQFSRWNHITLQNGQKVVDPGLTTRRSMEQCVFTGGSC